MVCTVNMALRLFPRIRCGKWESRMITGVYETAPVDNVARLCCFGLVEEFVCTQFDWETIISNAI